MSIGKRLQELRRLLGGRTGLTQAEMAKLMHASLRAYQNYEKDERQPQMEHLAELHIQKVNINWLISGNGGLFTGKSSEERPKAGSLGANQDLNPLVLSAVIDIVLRALDEENINLRTSALAELLVLVYSAVCDAITAAEASGTDDPTELASLNLERLLPLVSKLADVGDQGDFVVQLQTDDQKRRNPRNNQ